jgi:hypothetical protein
MHVRASVPSVYLLIIHILANETLKNGEIYATLDMIMLEVVLSS